MVRLGPDADHRQVVGCVCSLVVEEAKSVQHSCVDVVVLRYLGQRAGQSTLAAGIVTHRFTRAKVDKRHTDVIRNRLDQAA